MTRDACHWGGLNEPRHVGPSPRGSHAGCTECTRRHCRLCGITHVTEQTCPACIGAVRSDVHTIVTLTERLPAEAIYGSTPAGALLAAQPIPGGDATVLLAGGSDGRGQSYEINNRIIRRGETRPAPWADDELPGDPQPVEQLLASWEDDWRLTFGKPAAGLATIWRCADYLLEHLTYAAQHHDGFDQFADDIAKARGRLEDITGNGSSDQRGAACVHCGAVLVRTAKPRKTRGYCEGHRPHLGAGVCSWPRTDCCDRGGLVDEWHCPRCRRTYDETTYRNAVNAAWRLNSTALPALDIVALYGIPRGTLTSWVSRGLVHRRGKGSDGRQHYDVLEVRAMLGLDQDDQAAEDETRVDTPEPANT